MATTFQSARDLILNNVSRLPAEEVSLVNAVGRVLATPVYAPWDMPQWSNSAMDGFAVRTIDCVQTNHLCIHGYLPAGATPEAPVAAGTATRIMTGAPIPPGCDAVIPLEDTIENHNSITIRTMVKPGDHIRYQGEDVAAGELVLPTGTELRPAEINMLASFGYLKVPVYRRPVVAILSTGDELVEPGENIGPGQVVNSNAYSLAAAVKEAGGQPLLLGIARDTRESLKEKIPRGLKADALITSAGVSMGDRDLVCEMLEEAGVERLFWKVDIKPGRPTAFGLKDGKPVFSLPGNPVSTMVTFEEFVRPALLIMQGLQQVLKPYIKATLKEPVHKKQGRTQFLRVNVTDIGDRLFASSAGDQNTGILRTMLRANGIAILPATRDQFNAGEEVDIHLIGSSCVTSGKRF